MSPWRAALLPLLLLAGCYGSADPPGDAPGALGAASAPRWSEILSATSLRVAAIGDGDAIVAGTFAGPLAIGGARLVPRGSAPSIFVSRVDALGHHLWSEQLGGEGSLSSIASNARDVVLAGVSGAGVDLGGGALPGGAFLAKLDGSGGHLWSKGIAGAEKVVRVRTDGAGDVVALIRTQAPVDLGGGVIASPSGAIVAKLDASGRHRWSKGYGPEVHLHDIALTRDGDVIAVGELRGSYDFGGGPIATAGHDRDALVVRYDPEGSLRWSRRYGTPNDVQIARRVDADVAGALFVAQKDGSGDDLGLHKYDPRGGPLWRRELMGSVVLIATPSGDVVYATHHLNSGDTSLDVLDGEGREIEHRRWGYEHAPSIEDLAVPSPDTLLVAGAFQDELDLGGGAPLRSTGRATFIAAFELP